MEKIYNGRLTKNMSNTRALFFGKLFIGAERLAEKKID